MLTSSERTSRLYRIAVWLSFWTGIAMSLTANISAAPELTLQPILIEDRMVSANLPEHTPLTEMNSLTRTAAYLIQRGAEATEAEREAYEVRKKALMTKLSQT